MRTIIKFVLMSLIGTIGCKEKRNFIHIEGDINNLPDGKIYLTEAHNWKSLLDSTNCHSGHFRFMINVDSNFTPCMASIWYTDSAMPNKRNQLLFANKFLSTDTFKYASSAFFMKDGTIKMKGDIKSNENIAIQEGRENEIMFRFQRQNLGQLKSSDYISRKKSIDYIKNIAKEYHYSYFVFESIFGNKASYGKLELQTILAKFDKDIQSSPIGSKLKKYINSIAENGSTCPIFSLPDRTNALRYLIDTSAKLNMLIFWASWCGPCRAEIPQLKKLNKIYCDKGLKMTSVSMDADTNAWKTALDQEKMEWRQLITTPALEDQIKAAFNFSAIPMVVFTDNKRIRIAAFTGFDSSNIKRYGSVITRYLKE